MTRAQWSAWAVAFIIVLGGVSFRSTQENPAHGQIVTTSPSQGPQGPAGTPGTVEQRAVVTTASDGTYTWVYPSAYGAGVVPVVTSVAQATAGSTDVINVQLDGAPTNTQAKFRVTRTQQSVVALLGLTILSVPSSPGATQLHVTARSP